MICRQPASRASYAVRRENFEKENSTHLNSTRNYAHAEKKNDGSRYAKSLF